MFCLWQNSDTDMDIIAEFCQAVNENERFQNTEKRYVLLSQHSINLIQTEIRLILFLLGIISISKVILLKKPRSSDIQITSPIKAARSFIL